MHGVREGMGGKIREDGAVEGIGRAARKPQCKETARERAARKVWQTFQGRITKITAVCVAMLVNHMPPVLFNTSGHF